MRLNICFAGKVNLSDLKINLAEVIFKIDVQEISLKNKRALN